MKTMKMIIVSLCVFTIMAIFSSCGHKSGYKEGGFPKNLTDKETLDTCFKEIAEFEIVVNHNNQFSIAHVKKLNVFYEYSREALDSTAKTERTIYDYKKVHICLLKVDLPARELNQFVRNHGNFLTVQDMLALYEQNRFEIPPYVWILGGNFVDDIPAMCFLDNPKKISEFPRGAFFVFSNAPEAKSYKYKANYFAVAYWKSNATK